MAKVDFMVILFAIAFVVVLVIAVFKARKNGGYSMFPSGIFTQKLVKSRNRYGDCKKNYSQRLKSFYDGKIKIYRRGNRHH